MQEIKDQLHLWTETIKTKSPEKVAKLYSKSAILLPTLSNKVRTTPDSIHEYFIHFWQSHQSAQSTSVTVEKINDSTAINSGIYTFKLDPDQTAGARFTFVYEQNDENEWEIIEHHSSLLPE